MGNLYDLKTVQKTLDGGAGGTDLGIGAIELGKVRYVVWMKIHAPSANMVSLGSAAGETGALAIIKDKQGVGAGDTIAYPDVIDPNTCIFKIEGTTDDVFLGVVTNALVIDTELTIVYFDE